ncbi:MAG: tetratricopeptide repeat protein [Deltaproteobacteria bacterium]|nr:tetratricopeptide repeat protein [Deltaproteobacteria bacterium]
MKTLFACFAIFSFLSGCASFQVAGQVRAGRQALLVNDSEQALAYFKQAAQLNPDYIVTSVSFRQGIWSYVGRAQYNTGRLAEARKSLERALSTYGDDYLARLYLGLTLARTGERSRGAGEIERAMRGLNDWLEYVIHNTLYGYFWDPNREIRSEIQRSLALISGREVDWQTLIASGEWVGHKMEDEIDRVRQDESRHFRERDLGTRSGVFLGIGF